MDPVWKKIQTVKRAGLSSNTGLEVGLSKGQLRLANPPYDLSVVPVSSAESLTLDPVIAEAMPDLGLSYPELNNFVFGRNPESYLTGKIKRPFVGYAESDEIRIGGASGGVISQMLIHLLETKQIAGAIMLRLRRDIPYLAEPFIARTRQDVMSASGSIYTESSPLTILSELENEVGPLAFVGLPDHVAAVRKLQQLQHPSVKTIKYIFGPYTGTIMRFEALESYLASQDASLSDVTSLSYRAGEWPGYLEIKLRTGRVLRAEKFYYNYLIPFFITQRSSRLAVDFTNELTDISVGDAWAPEYEKKRGGYSVILARSTKGLELLESMQRKKLVTLTPVSHEKVVEMHAHMIDFKKRGTFIRMQWRALRGRENPSFGYKPEVIPFSRYLVEVIISGLFFIGNLSASHWLIERIPLSIVGPAFNGLRIAWKKISAKNKRSGLSTATFKRIEVGHEH